MNGRVGVAAGETIGLSSLVTAKVTAATAFAVAEDRFIINEQRPYAFCIAGKSMIVILFPSTLSLPRSILTMALLALTDFACHSSIVWNPQRVI